MKNKLTLSFFIFIILMLNLPDCSGSLQPLDDGITTIGIYIDSGAAPACVTAAKNMFESIGYTLFLLDADYVNNKDIQHIDGFYFPGGSAGPYVLDITSKGKEKIRSMIRAGSGYIGTCAGGMFAAEIQIWKGTRYTYGNLNIFTGNAIGPIPEIYDDPGIGMCQVNLHKPHPITDSHPDSMWIMYYTGPFFVPESAVNIDTIGTYEITGRLALAAFEYGKGRVFLTGPHPEWEEDDDRDSVSYFDNYDDHGSDWPLMQSATRWCLHEE
jgi:glutamine amidotransferase-like uncharacterized protein